MRADVPLWTAAAIAAATGGTPSTDFAVTGVAFDSREVGSGDLFVALSGEATDGHRFAAQAFAQGAAGAIVSRPVDGPHKAKIPFVFVGSGEQPSQYMQHTFLHRRHVK